MITCRDFIEFLWKYHSEELSPDERFEFDAHLAVCPSCVAYMDSYDQTIKLGKAACEDPGAPVPADVPEDLIHAILSAAHPRKD